MATTTCNGECRRLWTRRCNKREDNKIQDVIFLFHQNVGDDPRITADNPTARSSAFATAQIKIPKSVQFEYFVHNTLGRYFFCLMLVPMAAVVGAKQRVHYNVLNLRTLVPLLCKSRRVPLLC